MVRKFKLIQEDGEKIAVGAKGTIGSLMMRELESIKHRPNPSSSKKSTSTIASSVPCGVNLRRTVIRRNFTSESFCSSSCVNPRKIKKSRPNLYHKDDQHISMLDAYIEGKPNGKKGKGPCSVDVVDLKCGNLVKPRSNPISLRLKRLGFSKLSQSIA